MRIQNLLGIPCLLVCIAFFSCSIDNSENIPKVTEVNLEEIDPAQFSEEEWYMPYYLKHFAAVANSVLDTGANKGYFNLSVWRGSRNHHPYNARIMEGILSLVWFYCSDKPWNKYYQDPILKKRIEASLEFWCSIQNEDGRFSEYEAGKWGLAPTAFATKFIGRALWLLQEENQIDPEVLERSRIALRKAIYVGFTDEGLWAHGRNYTNQYANLWGGALSYLAVWPDEEIEELLRKRFLESMTEFQSPVGFFYESGGPDWGYNLNTHHSDLQVAWEYADDDLRNMIIEKTRSWYEWLSYNALKEPGSMCYYLNRAIETRQQKGYILYGTEDDPALQRWIPQAEFIPIAHAFEMNDTEIVVSRRERYQDMLQAYPKVSELEIGEFNAFTPYAFLHDGMEQWYPTDEQRKAAIQTLPYFRESDFIHLRNDNRSETKCVYVKNPSYYATFNYGNIVTKQQRFGLGLIWNQELGTIFQSQSKTDKAAYGTMAMGETAVYEGGDLVGNLKYKNADFEQTESIVDLEGGKLEITYRLGKQGEKSIVFSKYTIGVSVTYAGKFTEYLPLLISDQDELSIGTQKITIDNPNGTFVISHKGARTVDQEDFATDLNSKHCRVIKLSAEDSLSYTFTFPSQ